MCIAPLVVGLAAFASCRYTESLNGFDSEYGLGAGGSAAGGGGAAGHGGTFEGGAGTNPDGGDVVVPDGADVGTKDGDSALPETQGDTPLESLPDGNNCFGGRMNCDGNQANGCEVDTSNDPSHCGGCGNSCAGGDCVTSKCQPVVLALSQAMPWSIAVDATKLFWSNQGSGGTKGSINALPLGGGAAAPIAPDQSTPGDIVLDDSSVYWSNYSGGGAILKIGKNGQGFQSLTSNSGPWGIAVDSTNVYWTVSGGDVRKIPIGGGSASSVVSGELDPRGIALSSSKLFWSLTGNPGEAGPLNVGKIRSANLDGTNKMDLATGQAYPLAIVATASEIIWVATGTYSYGNCTQQDGKVMKVSKSGGSVTTLADAQACPVRLAVDGNSVYWTNMGTYSGLDYEYNGAVMRVPIAGGVPTAIAPAGDLVVSPYGIAVDATNVYWTVQGLGGTNGQIVRIVKN
jgi:hypothetical protein